MYGLDRFSVFVDKKPIAFTQIDSIDKNRNDTTKRFENFKQEKLRKRANILSSGAKSAEKIETGTEIDTPSGDISSKLKLNEYNLCNFVTRINYAIFAPEIHLQCNRPLVGRYIYIQADGRSNRWSRLFSAVLCEIQVYEN